MKEAPALGIDPAALLDLGVECAAACRRVGRPAGIAADLAMADAVTSWDEVREAVPGMNNLLLVFLAGRSRRASCGIALPGLRLGEATPATAISAAWTNADLGEGFGPWRMGQDQALLGLVSLANVACGFHAGDPVIMDRTVREAIRRGVDIGAHVSFLERQASAPASCTWSRRSWRAW